MKKLFALTVLVFSIVLKTFAQPCINPPSVSISATSSAICAGTNDTLTAVSSTAVSYTWSTGAHTSSIVVAPIMAAMASYTVTVIDANYCSASNSITLGVNPLPGITIHSSANPLCGGTADTLIASGGGNYAWSDAETGDTIIVTPTVTATYGVTGNNSYGCIGSASATITVEYPPPTPIITAIDADSVTFVASTGGIAASGPINYHWTAFDGSGHVFSGDTPDTINLIYYLRNCTLNVVASYVSSSPSSIPNPCTTSATLTITHAIVSTASVNYNLLRPLRPSKRGMYLENCCDYIGSADSAIKIANFCRKNQINYVLLDGTSLYGGPCAVFGQDSIYVDSLNAIILGNFIDTLKTLGRVAQVGVVVYQDLSTNADSNAINVALYDLDNFSNSVRIYNWAQPWPYKIDILSFDEEFSNPDKYSTYASSVSDFHQVHMPMLKAMYNATRHCPENDLRVEDYIEAPLNIDTLYTNPTQSMELDSIALYADRILLSSYTYYSNVLWNRGDWIQADSEIGRNPYKAYYKKEVWPVFGAENEYYSGPKCFEHVGDDYSGHWMRQKGEKPDSIEQIYYDSLNFSQKHQVWTDDNYNYTKTSPMLGDTCINIWGNMWFQYKCLSLFAFDTNVATSARRYYVTLPHDYQWSVPSVMPPKADTIKAVVHGGKAPFTYFWFDASNGFLLKSGPSDTLIARYYYPSYPSQIQVIALDANNKAVTDYMNIYQICQQGPQEKPVLPQKKHGKTEQPSIYSVNVYPNPAHSVLNIQMLSSGLCYFQLYNTLGQKVKEAELTNMNNILDISLLQSGVYFYRVINTQSTLMKSGKLMIIR